MRDAAAERAASTGARDRLREHARRWRVALGDTFETDTSVLAFGERDDRPVILKITRQRGDEWRSGEALQAFEGRGAARVYECDGGAVLLERLDPGTSLARMSLDGGDDEATRILARVIRKMSPGRAPDSCPTVEDWAQSFERYAAGGSDAIPRHLFDQGRRLHVELCGSQTDPRLLHGDLHHYNVLLDSERGWLAIDPKGVIGEVEYEIGAALRNPYERPELFAEASQVQRRLEAFAVELDIDVERALAWSFAQAVLSAIWGIEDGFTVDAANPSLRLAEAIRPML